MDNNNWRPAAPGGDATADTVDWRTQLQPDARQRIVDKIMDTLKKHLPCSVQEGLQELRGIAVRFEEKIYTAAVSQPDYLRKISLKMLTMENKSQNTTMSNAVAGNNSVGGNRIQDGASHGIPSQVQSQVQAHPQSQSHQPMVPQSVQNSMAQSVVQNSNGVASSLQPNMVQAQMANVSGLTNNNIQNMSAISQNTAGNQLGQAVPSNSFSNSQRQLAGRQQVVQQQTAQPQNSQYLFQQQLQQQLMKSTYPHGNHSQPMLPSHVQQQQNMQQSVGQQSSVMQQSMMQNPSMVALQQNQASSVQQQQVPRQQQQPSIIHQQQSQMMKQQMMVQQTSSSGMQQNPLIGQQNGMGELQQQRLLQQNGIQNMQQPQQMLSQQSSMHPQQMSSQNSATLQQQQQQLLNSQTSNSTMSSNQQAVHMLQQKVSMQQQHNGPTLIKPQGQQPQSQAPPQQLMQMQSSATQLQQHLTMQQQPNAMQRDLQQRMQQGHPTNNLMQSQTIMDQQKQLYQSQRLPDSSSLDPSPQNGQANIGDWQEEAYQKIKQMKEASMVELNEMYQKLSAKIQQNDAINQPQAKSDANNKLKVIKQMVERIMQVLQLSKNEISSAMKDKLDVYEKQISSILANNRPRKPMQQPNLSQSHVQTMQQQPHDNNGNPQLQPMNMQPPSSAMPMSSMHHSSMSSISGMSTPQQNMMNPMQPMESSHGTSMGSLQPTPQSSVITHQSMQQNSVSMLQQNIPIQPNSNLLSHQQQIKQHQDQQMKQQFQQRQVQQLLQKQQQQLHHQAKQQMPTQQISQLHHMTDANDTKVRPSLKPNSFQQLPASTQRPSYPHQQIKASNSFSISSPQLLQVVSPQIPQHSSPQVEQQSVLSSLPKTGTPLQSASSPFVVPSPSTPLAPSPMPGDTEKPAPTSLINTTHQQTHTAPTHPPTSAIAIGTPGISASPLLAEFTAAENTPAAASGKLTSAEQPIERLLKAVKSLSPKALSSAVNDIGSVVTMIDRIAGSAPGNGSRAAVGEDLVAMTKCRLQARNCATQDGITGTRKMKRYTSAMPLNVASSVGSFSDSYKQMNGSEAEIESTATSKAKKPRIESNHALIDEIRYINQRLIDTVVEISDEDVDPTAAVASADCGEGTVVKCTFTAVALSPELKTHYASSQFWSPIQPLRLLIPASYPKCSPILLDKLSPESKNSEDLGAKAKAKLGIYLRRLTQPMSVGDIAKMWGMCARSIISEQTQRMGGGTFTSKYGSWENCLTTA